MLVFRGGKPFVNNSIDFNHLTLKIKHNRFIYAMNCFILRKTPPINQPPRKIVNIVLVTLNFHIKKNIPKLNQHPFFFTPFNNKKLTLPKKNCSEKTQRLLQRFFGLLSMGAMRAPWGKSVRKGPPRKTTFGVD